jgi:uncharacterized membrane protein
VGADRHLLLIWLGHLHPLIVHFPLALLLAAFLAEALGRVRPACETTSAARFCLALGATSAIPAASLGWLLAEELSHRGLELELHRWLGVTVAIGSILVWRGGRRWPQRHLELLLVLAAVLGATGHTGGVLSYGADWLKLSL